MTTSQNLCEIKYFVVHKMDKNTEEAGAEAIPSLGGELLEINEGVQLLIEALNKKYIEQSKSFGKFDVDQDNYPVSKYIDECFYSEEKNDDFYLLSERTLKHLCVTATGNASTSGWVVISLYSYCNNDCFIVAIVNDSKGASIDNSFAVSPTVFIDLNKLRHACRVNLTLWKKSQERYVSFIRGGRDSSYFKKFIGCNDTHEIFAESKKITDAVIQFCMNKSMTFDERNEVCTLAHSFLKKLNKDSQVLSLSALANHLFPNEPTEFSDYICSDFLQISEGFIPDGRALSGLVRFEAKGRDWKLSYNRSAWQEMDYDPKTKLLMIKINDQETQNALMAEMPQTTDNPG